MPHTLGVACAMTSDLAALCFDAHRPAQLARFWSELLGRKIGVYSEDEVELLPGAASEFPIRFFPTQEQKQGQNRAHFDLTSSSLEEQEQIVARALELGAKHIDVGQLPEEEHVVLADPESNEFCVIEPGNDFLAGCGVLGALAGDGSQEAGYFWSKVLGWPLVWDEDQETAIQSPRGGAKLTWGGPPLMPRTHTDRLHFDCSGR
ncbi:conserved hypothetical protein [Renibacterium salmoninarum ATCC 33209]|uniref:Glyoxalase-like domain-containing protein n=1 Tax=Renibacterium salmoninarum (strain ATCC 33209 / DSM 20767 / JCM 11484 / NBRC 15589 / NCIMB 2235) TaxID=288705 RepID=A9WPE2_RENSM|nr:conserved hypothetical protein [Renibacterium salmoninarum ATCC 33209]